MKFLLSVAAIIAVATALPTKRSVVSPIPAGPAILVDENNNPISIGPDFVGGVNDFVVIPDAGVITAPIFPILPTPTVTVPAAPSTPLVQIIVNVNTPDAGVAPEPVHVVDNVIDPIQIVDVMPVVDPIQIVDVMPVVDPVQIVDVMPVVDPVQIVDVMPVVDPVQIVDVMPVVDPVQVVDPIIPSPAVNLPEELN